MTFVVRADWRDEDDISDASVHESDDDDVPLAKRKKVSAPAAKKPAPKPRSRKVRQLHWIALC